MEFVNDLPTPVSQLTRAPDPDVTLFVSKNGEFIHLPTEEQAKTKVAKMMKKFKPEEWWAQKVSKYKVGKKDHLCAYIKRDYSKDHDRSDFSNTSDSEMWLGRMVIGIPAKRTDTGEHSETRGERIIATEKAQLSDGSVIDVPILEKRGFYSYHEATPANIKMYQTMSGMTSEGNQTSFVYVLLNGGRNVGEDDPEDFWKTATDDAMIKDRKLKKIQDNEALQPPRPVKLT